MKKPLLQDHLKSRTTLPLVPLGVFLLCAIAGLAASGILRHNTSDSNAASANITVVNNDQQMSIDQSGSAQTLQRTSQVTTWLYPHGKTIAEHYLRLYSNDRQYQQYDLYGSKPMPTQRYRTRHTTHE